MVDVAYAESRFSAPEIAHKYGANVHLLDDPLGWSLLARACSPETGQPDVGRLIKTIYEMHGDAGYRVTSLGQDGKPGGKSVDADLTAER